ncbi:MAG: amidohydrolase family protein [Acidobacteria bacterium]|nr:amidohydrolase family protein [Acidobacteriota bacterium]NIQ87068.1 amidohydrolase family protein [Acidobacteriota bacterium]
MNSWCRSLICLALVTLVLGVPASAETVVLFKDVRVFDGVDPKLLKANVLVEGRKISKISSRAIDAPDGAVVIEGNNRVLSPGFIDLHAHLTFQAPKDAMSLHPWAVGAIAGKAAEHYLMSGFTSIRDAGGTHPDIARIIESGTIEGPRVFPSGAVITQTSGHGDFRGPADAHPMLSGDCVSHYLGNGHSVIADGVPEWLAGVRENLKHGATQIKIMGGGGVASDYDPIHTLQPSPEEIRAAVQAASDWDTYVLAHSYTSEAVTRLVENGVKVIEHGLLIDDETARLVAENDVVISTQVKIFRMGADLPGMSDENRRKMLEVQAGQDNLISLVKKYDIKTGFGTDFVFGMYNRIGEEFTARAEYFTPAEIMRQATSESAEVIRMAGKLNRYDNFGEIREGWLADLVLIEGNPMEDISILENQDNLAVIMKAGRIVKRP